jgi:type I restriction enzyme S subunit
MNLAIAKLNDEVLLIKPWTLPEGWCWATLEDVADGPQYGWTASATATGKVRLLRTTDISSGKVDWTTVPFCSESPPDVEKYLLRDGDIVISRAGSVGKSFLISKPLQAVFASYLIRFQPRVDGNYLNYFLQTRAYWAQIGERSAGIAIPNVNGSKLKSVRLPLAPLPEQRRIVARVDALFSEIGEGEMALAAVRKGLNLFRRALLKAAVTGKLTSDWRTANPGSETGYDLLVRIAKDGADRPPARGGRHRSVDALPLDATALPTLPATWAWATVRDVGAVQLGRQRAPQHHTGENMRPYLRVANVFEDRIDFTSVKEMNFTPDEFKTYELKPGDILLNEGQTPDFLGRPAMWRGEFEGYCFQNTLLRFQARAPMNAEFCLLVFRHYLHAKRFKKESQITTNIAHLSSGRFVIIEFPVPPLKEQAEIVRRVSEGLTSAADTLAMLDAEAADAAQLKQSILKAAFEGRLVPQDPADEPASALLARLAANPLAVSAKRGRGRKSNP